MDVLRFPEAVCHLIARPPPRRRWVACVGLVIILYGAPNMIYHGALRSDASAKTGMVGKLQSLVAVMMEVQDRVLVMLWGRIFSAGN